MDSLHGLTVDVKDANDAEFQVRDLSHNLVPPELRVSKTAPMKLVKQDIDRRTGAGSATLLPEEPEDMASKPWQKQKPDYHADSLAVACL